MRSGIRKSIEEIGRLLKPDRLLLLVRAYPVTILVTVLVISGAIFSYVMHRSGASGIPCQPAEPLRVIVGNVEFHFPTSLGIQLKGEGAPKRHRHPKADPIQFYCQTPSESPFESRGVFVSASSAVKDMLGSARNISTLSIGQASEGADVFFKKKLAEEYGLNMEFKQVEGNEDLLAAEIWQLGWLKSRRYVTRSPGLFGRPAIIDCSVSNNPSPAGERLFGDRCKVFLPISEWTMASAQFYSANIPLSEWTAALLDIENWLLSSISEEQRMNTFASRHPMTLQEFFPDLIESSPGNGAEQ
jgi:hypothetical protein